MLPEVGVKEGAEDEVAPPPTPDELGRLPVPLGPYVEVLFVVMEGPV